MAAEITHGLAVSAAGTAAIGEVNIGSIELPTRGQPWKLHHFMGQVVRQTATAAEMFGGYMGLDSVSGDISPDPAPSRFPLFDSGSLLGTTAPGAAVPLQRYDMDLDAAGKANIDLVYNQAIAVTVAPIVNLGIAFGPNIPVKRPFKFCDRVRTTITATGNTQIGTITISEKATRITAIMGFLRQDGVIVAVEELTGIFNLRSDDVDLVPSFWLFNEVFNAGAGTTINAGMAQLPQPHMVDIPLPGGSRIDCFADLTTAVTNAADVEVFIFYE